MKIIRVFPRQTEMTPRDEYAFVGDPPAEIFRPAANEVQISCTFTWDIAEATRLKSAWEQYYSRVKIGGCAYDDPCNGFIPGLYIRDGVVFTSRGCNNQCPWCEAWKREGKLRELPTIYAGNIIQDNNLLQCSAQHIQKVFSMLSSQHSIEFKGGLDSRLFTEHIAEALRSLRVKQVFFACDTKESIKPLRKAIQTLALPRDKVRCYVLLKFNPSETISEATGRLLGVWDAGAIPFAQLFQPKDKWIDYAKGWTRFARLWQRPAATKAIARQLLE